MRSRTRVIALGTGVLLLLGCTAAVAAAPAVDVACTIDANTLTCPLPVVPPVTVTETVTAPAVTVTVTASPSASPTPTPSPSPTPTPSPTPSPTLTVSSTPPTSTTTTPVGSTWPGADTTGVPTGVTLTNSGGITVTVAGTVIDGKNITGGVVVRAANVVIKNSRISGGGNQCVYVQSGSATIEDSEITGGCENGIGFGNWKAYRTEITGAYGDGVKFGSNVTLQDSWIHDLAPAAGAHADGGQMQFGLTNLVIKHNVIDLGTTPRANAALFMAPDQGPNTNGPVLIDNNKINGGNYILYCVDGNNGQYIVKNITITNNRFGNSFQYGRSSVNVPITQSGNVIDSTGAALNL